MLGPYLEVVWQQIIVVMRRSFLGGTMNTAVRIWAIFWLGMVAAIIVGVVTTTWKSSVVIAAVVVGVTVVQVVAGAMKARKYLRL